MRDRFERQADLVPQARLAELAVDVIGVGAVGRQVALQLAAMGVRRLRLIDFDYVESTNVTTQGYLHDDLDRLKVEATAAQVRRIDPSIDTIVTADRYRSRYGCSEAVFCCVDSIAVRATVWRCVQGVCRFWCDARMLGEVIRVLTVAGPEGRPHYGTTLFRQSEAQPGRCTAQGTIYTANVAAGLMLHQFSRWLRGIAVDTDVTVNLLSSELAMT